MKSYAFFIGIDVSKETLDFALIVSNSIQFHLQVGNDKQGIEQFIKQVKKQNKEFTFKNSLFAWSIPLGQPRGIYNNPLPNYLHQKQADI